METRLEKSRRLRQERLTRYSGTQRAVERVILATVIVIPLPALPAIISFICLALLSNGIFHAVQTVCSKTSPDH